MQIESSLLIKSKVFNDLKICVWTYESVQMYLRGYYTPFLKLA